MFINMENCSMPAHPSQTYMKAAAIRKFKSKSGRTDYWYFIRLDVYVSDILP